MNEQLKRTLSKEHLFFESLLKDSGITINGDHAWDVQIHNPKAYDAIIKQGSLGLGESYMKGWWDCERLDVLFEKLLKNQLDKKIQLPLNIIFTHTAAKIFNFQSKKKAVESVKHYNIGNNLFKAMLDKHMIYSCGYFKETNNLDEAQIAKLKLCCEKLKLRPGMKILDIGCGWGGLAKFAADHYGVSVVGITLSKEQFEVANTVCRDSDVDIRLQDYRDIEGSFDRIVSVGMFEHVGHLNYPKFMKTIHQSLKDEGLFLLHTIGVDKTATLADAWIRKYIFPHGMLPSLTQVSLAAESSFIMEDLQNFGPYYDQTLMAWHQNFIHYWPDLSAQYDETFYRMWNYYLLSCAGGFRARAMQLWQIVFSKGSYPDTYIAPR